MYDNKHKMQVKEIFLVIVLSLDAQSSFVKKTPRNLIFKLVFSCCCCCCCCSINIPHTYWGMLLTALVGYKCGLFQLLRTNCRLFIVSFTLQATTFMKKFLEYIHKIQNTSLFLKSSIVLSPLEYSPSTATHLCQCLIQLSENFWSSIFGVAMKGVFNFSITFFQLLRLLKRVPVVFFFTRLDRKKSQRATSVALLLL